LVCDATVAAAVIEFLNGEMIVYKGTDLPIPVLENDSYATSMENYNRQKSCRYTTAAKAFEQLASTPKEDQLEFAFTTLEEVALDASWSIVYDIKNGQIYFNTASNRDISLFNLSTFDFSCATPKLLFDLDKSRSTDISTHFVAFDFSINRSKMNDGILTNAIRLPKLFIEALEQYPLTCKCED
jgi:penicillin V acylase-like amidase (Ntn superfamily)